MEERPGLNGVIAGRYSIEGEIGRGGMATVYRARDLRHDSVVALKVLRPDLAVRFGGERFNREIRITASLRHPHIVPVFDSGVADDLPWYAMPFVEGESLAGRLERTGPLPIEEAVGIAVEIAGALSYAHAQGFVHRDIKPGNILLSHGHALLADFGIGRAIDSIVAERMTETGLTLGTVSYMSPEQAAGEPIDGRSDVYSLGCVVYEMLAGAPPFTGPSRTVLARHSAGVIPGLRAVREAVTPELEAAVLGALAKVPSDRYATATEFGEALVGALRQEPHFAGAGPRARPGPPRRRWLAAGLAAAAVVGVAGWLLARAGPGSGELDANRVVVFPLVVSDRLDGQASAGEDVATMIEFALDGAGPLRWIDGWSLLDPERRQDIRNFTLADQREIARAQAAAFFISGRIVPVSDSVQVSLELNDARTGEVARGSGTGTAAEVWRPGVRAVIQLLPDLIGGVSAAGIEDNLDLPPKAIASFLLAERAFRRVQLEEALEHYRDAVAADSTFSVATIRGAQAATWSHQDSEAASFLETARRQAMAPRYAAFVAGYDAYLRGDADSAAKALLSATRLDDRMAVAWMQLGETYTHLLPGQGSPDSLAEHAFQEARRLDPSAGNQLYHLIEIHLRRGDADGAAPLIRQFLGGSPDSSYAAHIRIMDDCVRNGPDRVDWRRVALETPVALSGAVVRLAGGGAAPECATAAYRAILEVDTLSNDAAGGRRLAALIGLPGVLIARDSPSAALATIREFTNRWRRDATAQENGLVLLGAPFIEEYGEPARTIADTIVARFGPDLAELRSRVRLWELGVFEAREGNLKIARAAAAQYRSRLQSNDAPGDSMLAESLDAHIALATGDTARALEILDRSIPARVPSSEVAWYEDQSQGYDRLTLTRLLMNRGENARAIAVADVLDSSAPAIYPLFVRASLELRLQAAHALRDSQLEERLRQRLDRLSQKPGPT